MFNPRIWNSFNFKMINLSITECHKKEFSSVKLPKVLSNFERKGI
jgi:hypothetical protein